MSTSTSEPLGRARKDLLHGPVGRTLLELAGPMVFGLTAVILFGVVDTFYVGRLGATELAAMSFTFPVSFFVMGIAMGMSVGMTSTVARAVGAGDFAQVRRLTTDGLVLANLIVVLFAVAGLLTIDPLFGALGAGEETRALIRRYMIPWYLGVGLLVIPMVGNGALRATGDTKSPSLIMVCSGLVNIVLDPLLIFGIGPFPRLELVGAALATVIAWGTTFAAALWLLGRRERMLDVRRCRVADVLSSWRRILYVALPAAGTAVLNPVGAGILTRMVADFGPAAVAGFGVATRVEQLATIGIFALGAAMAPFVGQNFGARDCVRIREALRFSRRVSIFYGLGMGLVLGLFARGIAGVFSDEPDVTRVAAVYLSVVPVSYVLYGFMFLVSATFNATNHPLRSAFVVSLRIFVLAVPLAWIGAKLAGTTGLFAGVACANATVGIVAWLMVRRFLADVETRFDAEPGHAGAAVRTAETPG